MDLSNSRRGGSVYGIIDCFDGMGMEVCLM